jgi:hypothetical protein
MNEEINVGGESIQESVQTDTVQASENTSTGVTGLTEMLGKAAEEVDSGNSTETSQDTAEKDSADQPKISGGIKGRLLEAEKKGEKKGYDAGRQAAQQEYQSRMAEVQARLDKLAEYELKEEAVKLAKAEGCSEALAMRILRAEKGLPPVATSEDKSTEAQPRDSNGRFAKKESTADSPKPDMTARAQFLFEQAQSIKRRTGADAMDLYAKADSETQRKIANGEIDFEDLVASQGQSKRTPPVVKANGGIGNTRLSEMSASDFSKLDDYVKKGGVIDLRR